MRVAVVGAGVVGMSTTASLLCAGVEAVCFEASAVVMGERSAGSSRIFRLAHADPDLVALAAVARAGFDRWTALAGTPMVDPAGCVVSDGDAAVRAAAMAAAGAEHRLLDTARDATPDTLRLPAAVPLAGPVLVDPGGGVVDVDAVRAFLGGCVGRAVVHERVEAVEGADRVTVRTAGGRQRFDAVVLAAGAGTSALAAGAGIDVPAALEHHVRFTFPLADPPTGAGRPAWIDSPPDALRTYQHRTGPGRWSVGATLGPDAVGWERGRDAAAAASQAAVLAHVRERLTVQPQVVESLYCTHAPDTGDGIGFGRGGPVLAVWGENLMKFAPVLGEVLAGAAMDRSTPRVPALAAALG